MAPWPDTPAANAPRRRRSPRGGLLVPGVRTISTPPPPPPPLPKHGDAACPRLTGPCGTVCAMCVSWLRRVDTRRTGEAARGSPEADDRRRCVAQHGGPAVPHSFGSIGVAVPLQSRRWCVALCRAVWGGQSDGVGVVSRAVVLWGCVLGWGGG